MRNDEQKQSQKFSVAIISQTDALAEHLNQKIRQKSPKTGVAGRKPSIALPIGRGDRRFRTFRPRNRRRL